MIQLPDDSCGKLWGPVFVDVVDESINADFITVCLEAAAPEVGIVAEVVIAPPLDDKTEDANALCLNNLTFKRFHLPCLFFLSVLSTTTLED